MGATKDFNNILDECLEHLLTDGETIDQCLAHYPEQTAELRPLLETALAARKVSNIQPRSEFRARARHQFRTALQAVPVKKGFFPLAWPRWATVVAVVLVLLLSGGSAVAVANNSMPDEPLYPLKVATEQVRLVLTLSDIGKADLHAELADRRVTEIASIASRAEPEKLDETINRLNTHLVMVATLAKAQTIEEKAEITKTPAPALAPAASPPTEAGQDTSDYTTDSKLARLRVAVTRYAVKHPAALREMLNTAPESAKPALRRALTIAEARYRQALEAIAESGRER